MQGAFSHRPFPPLGTVPPAPSWRIFLPPTGTINGNQRKFLQSTTQEIGQAKVRRANRRRLAGLDGVPFRKTSGRGHRDEGADCSRRCGLRTLPGHVEIVGDEGISLFEVVNREVLGGRLCGPVRSFAVAGRKRIRVQAERRIGHTAGRLSLHPADVRSFSEGNAVVEAAREFLTPEWVARRVVGPIRWTDARSRVRERTNRQRVR